MLQIAEVVDCFERVEMNIRSLARCSWWQRMFQTKHYLRCRHFLGRDIDILEAYVLQPKAAARAEAHRMLTDARKAYRS